MRVTSKQSLGIVFLLLGGFFLAALFSLSGSGKNSSHLSLNAATPTAIPQSKSNNSSAGTVSSSALSSSASGALDLKSAAPASTGSSLDVVTASLAALSGGTVELNGPVVEIKDFKRSETKDGKLAWDLAGSRAAYRVGSDHITLEYATISTRIRGGELVTLSTPAALVALSGTSLKGATARGVEDKEIEITTEQGVRITTPEAIYRADSGDLHTEKGIKIFHPRGSQTSDVMRGNTQTGVFVFTGNVHTTILPAS